MGSMGCGTVVAWLGLLRSGAVGFDRESKLCGLGWSWIVVKEN